MFLLNDFINRAPDGIDGGDTDASGGGDSSPGDQGKNEPQTLDDWLAAQPDKLKATLQPLIDSHITKLKNTVKATREERDAFSAKLADAIKKLEDGSDLRKEFETLQAASLESGKRADFYEAAPSQECLNPKVAYATAKALDLFKKDGQPDWTAIKAAAPELFGKPQARKPRATAGSGKESGSDNATSDMTSWIRERAGIRTED